MCAFQKSLSLVPFGRPRKRCQTLMKHNLSYYDLFLFHQSQFRRRSACTLRSCLHFGQNERILHQNRVEKFFSNSFTQKSDSFWVISRHMCEDLEQSKQHHTCVCFAKTIKLSFPPLFLGESRAWKMRISDVWVGEKWSKWLVFRDIHSSFCSTRR